MSNSQKAYKQFTRPMRIFIMDEILLTLSSLMAILLVRWLTEAMFGFTSKVLVWVGAAAVASAAGILLTKSHHNIQGYTTVRSLAKTILSVAVKEVLLTVALIAGLVRFPDISHMVLLILADAIFSIASLLGIRAFARFYMADNTPATVIQKAARRTALVHGTGQESVLLASQLKREGYEVLGLVVHNPSMAGLVVADYVVYSISDDEDMAQLQWRLGGVDCVYFPQGLSDAEPGGKQDKTEVAQNDGMSVAGHVLKRSFDIALSAILLLIFSPVICLCALAVKREDGGPVIYKQERIGRGGYPFYIYKFRSMRQDAEAEGNPALYSGEEDPRLTRTGRFLRAHHLDELPQLWNVLKGDMSFIGPRPERSYYIGQIMQRNPRYRYLLQIRPGVTSYATLYNGYTDSLEKMLTRLDLDLYYLRNHSIWFDAKVLGLTFLSIVSGKKF